MLTAAQPNASSRQASSLSLSSMTTASGLSRRDLQAAALAYCRRDLGSYGIAAHGLVPAAVHEQWIDGITRTVSGQSERRRLLIVAPPGHAKSTWTSLIFPTWYLGNHPDHSLLFFTSADTMARQFGGAVKSVLEGSD